MSEPDRTEIASDDAREPGRDRRVILLGGGLVAALVLGSGAFLLLGGQPAAPSAVSTLRQPVAAGSPSPMPVPTETPVAPAPGRNPFAALVTDSVAGTGPDPAGPSGGTPTGTGPAPAPTEPSPATSDPVAPSDPVFPSVPSDPVFQTDPVFPSDPVVPPPVPAPPPAPPAPPPAPPTDPPVPPADPPVVAYSLELVSIVRSTTFRGYVENWVVDGAPVTTRVGQRFGKYGEIVIIALSKKKDPTSGATVQVGDTAPIFVATGTTVQVL